MSWHVMVRRLGYCLLLLQASAASAAEILSLDVRRDDGRVHVVSSMTINAPPDLVFATLSDYAHLSRLSSRFKVSRVEPPADDGTARVYTLIEGCVWFFCRSVERYARLVTVGTRQIETTVEPEHSDFSYGYERWVISSAGEGTRVDYTHDLDPNFWVPPMLGVWAIRRTLQSDALRAATRIERMARRQ